MARTEDLKRTLLANILDNEDYPHLEFVVLNYNSPDDMHGFMTSREIMPYVEIGRVQYLRTQAPSVYSPSHSKNVAFRNARGAIVLNVDADNFTGRGFAAYVNRLANVRSTAALFSKGKRRTHGRIGMFKSEFEALGGYDEDLEGYGWEDISLLIRAMESGCTMMWWRDSDVDFTRRILTPRERVSLNMKNTDWRLTERLNRELSLQKQCRGDLVVNLGRNWGYVRDLERSSSIRHA